MDRRGFLKAGGLLSAATACAGALPLLPVLSSGAVGTKGPPAKCKYGMVIDLTKCKPGCTACLDACRNENNVVLDTERKWDILLIRKVTVEREFPARSAGQPAKEVLLLCNHCDHPPCAQACPVQATYKRPDGIVVVDQHRCIGCRYCMIACPYNARHYHFKEAEAWPNKDRPRSMHGVPQSCDLCAHRLDRGEAPACVQRCEEINGRDKALFVGNLNDPGSDVSRKIAESGATGLREDLGTRPKVFYIGL